jgi:hypothetical protein
MISFVNKRAKYEPDPSHFYLISALYVLLFKVGPYVKMIKTFFFLQKLHLIEHKLETSHFGVLTSNISCFRFLRSPHLKSSLRDIKYSTNKTDRHDIIEILLKVALNVITSSIWHNWCNIINICTLQDESDTENMFSSCHCNTIYLTLSNNQSINHILIDMTNLQKMTYFKNIGAGRSI